MYFFIILLCIFYVHCSFIICNLYNIVIIWNDTEFQFENDSNFNLKTLNHIIYRFCFFVTIVLYPPSLYIDIDIYASTGFPLCVISRGWCIWFNATKSIFCCYFMSTHYCLQSNSEYKRRQKCWWYNYKHWATTVVFVFSFYSIY